MQIDGKFSICGKGASLTATVRVNLSGGCARLAANDVAGVTSIVNARVTADGKTYVYSFSRELSDLFLVDGVQ